MNGTRRRRPRPPEPPGPSPPASSASQILPAPPPHPAPPQRRRQRGIDPDDDQFSHRNRDPRRPSPPREIRRTPRREPAASMLGGGGGASRDGARSGSGAPGPPADRPVGFAASCARRSESEPFERPLERRAGSRAGSSPRRERERGGSEGLRNRRRSDSGTGSRRSEGRSGDDGFRVPRFISVAVRPRGSAPSAASNGSKARRSETRSGRTARILSLGTTLAILLLAFLWGISASVRLVERACDKIFMWKEERDHRRRKGASPRRHREARSTAEADGGAPLGGLRGTGPEAGNGDGGGLSRHDLNRFHRGADAKKKKKGSARDEKRSAAKDRPPEGMEYLGEDATRDFFYAGRRSARSSDGAPGGSEADPATAYSYAALPLSDCSPFVASVWAYLSPGSETGSADGAEGPRVLLSAKGASAASDGGCRSDVFGGPAAGLVLYAQPHHGDGDDNDNNNADATIIKSYRINIEYSTDEEKCHTLIGGNVPPIKEGEWHHVVLFVTEVDDGEERIGLYVDGNLAGARDSVSRRSCRAGPEAATQAGRLVLDPGDRASEPRFDLNGRLGMLSYWETGGPEVLTPRSERMAVSTTRNEEHVARSMYRARFDVGAVKELSLQGLTVREPSLLFTFDGRGAKAADSRERNGDGDGDKAEDANSYKDPTRIEEVMAGRHGKIYVLSPLKKLTIDRDDDKPFRPLGGNRYPEYKDGTYAPQRSGAETAQLDDIALARSRRVKAAMEHLWRGYKTYAWGKDELLPLSKGGQDNWGGMGTTLLDSLSTLWLMGMEDEFWDARDWIERYLDFNNVRKAVSVFETTIRNLGSLLSAHDLTGDRTFLVKAEDLGTRLLKAFSTPRGVPFSEVELFDGGRAFNTGWHSNSAVLSEIGTLQLEFRHLARATGKTEFATVAMRALDELLKLETETGLFPTFIHNTKSFLSFANNDVSIGAMGDSFYEYLLKIWLQGGKTESVYRQMYDKAIKGIMDNLVCRKNGLTYVAELNDGKLRHKMDHLSCFLGGNMALGAYTHPDGLESKEAQRQLITGKQLAYTCYQMYARGKFGLSPEYVQFGGAKGKNDFSPASDAPYYILRPEASETFFILYHLTKDDTYRQWGWEVFRAIEEYCRTESGYAAIKNVDTGQQNNRMESFFPAETLKYLYLLQSKDDKLDLLNTHVLNTEAHPLRLLQLTTAG